MTLIIIGFICGIAAIIGLACLILKAADKGKDFIDKGL